MADTPTQGLADGRAPGRAYSSSAQILTLSPPRVHFDYTSWPDTTHDQHCPKANLGDKFKRTKHSSLTEHPT